MPKVLLQIHHQFRDGRTEMCTQREVNGYDYDEIHQFWEDTKISHPLPEGAHYLAVPEGSPLFWMTTVE